MYLYFALIQEIDLKGLMIRTDKHLYAGAKSSLGAVVVLLVINFNLFRYWSTAKGTFVAVIILFEVAVDGT